MKTPMAPLCAALELLLLSSLFAIRAPAEEDQVFGYRDVVKRAEDLVKEPFIPQEQELSPDLRNLDYDTYRRIRFLPEHTVWGSAPYRLGFFHPGYYYKQRVLFHAIERNRLRDIPFSPAYFHYDRLVQFGGHETFVGFKTFVPSARPGVQDEFLSFLGASYFRAIARGLHWGLSTRGLAVNNGIVGPEEFPYFREFWMREPAPGDHTLRFFALLDSQSVTGGYQFDVQYGDVTIIDVKATVFLRKKVEALEIAPLTTMFYFGENSVNKPTLKPDYQPTGKTEFSMNKTDFKRREFRPEVHDSDGLLMNTRSGEKLWAPLDNPRRVVVRRFSDVTSFGMLQRDRDINHYLDREAEYDRRPSLLITPKSDFGPGFVRLLQIPSEDEYTDNMVAGWELQPSPEAGGRFEFAYELRWTGEEPDSDQFRVASTTVRPNPQTNETRFTVEYDKPEKADLIPVGDLRPYVVVNQPGEVRDTQFTPIGNGWLVTFTIYNPTPAQGLDVSCVILRQDKFCSEKWLYLLSM
ncbi:MAG: glucan biosynthesis protein [Verrucomicrobia bacterium]|nr:glucan biosynthesis protein [Verrucomicrobiota bacterium]